MEVRLVDCLRRRTLSGWERLHRRLWERGRSTLFERPLLRVGQLSADDELLPCRVVVHVGREVWRQVEGYCVEVELVPRQGAIAELAGEKLLLLVRKCTDRVLICL